VRTGPTAEPRTPGATVGESEWIARARAGDAAAFGRLVELHQDRAYGLALRLIGSAVDAEEAAQDAFVRAWRALPAFRGESSFGTWLHRIVARCALDASVALRARRSRETGLEALERGTQADPAAGIAEPHAALSRRLERLMETLGQEERAVVSLYYHEDRSVQEVAKALGMPVGTVKTHLHRARAALRRAWLREEAARTGS
jgi:RNA polymerase sigma-70 factor (ECF subfamily)